MPTWSKPRITPFQRRVYRELLRIPRGSVISYAELARRIGCNSPRAVGQALRVNPYAPRVPCHRVISSDLSLGGFFGSKSNEILAQKKALLEAEGIRFSPSGKIISPSQTTNH